MALSIDLNWKAFVSNRTIFIYHRLKNLFEWLEKEWITITRISMKWNRQRRRNRCRRPKSTLQISNSAMNNSMKCTGNRTTVNTIRAIKGTTTSMVINRSQMRSPATWKRPDWIRRRLQTMPNYSLIVLLFLKWKKGKPGKRFKRRSERRSKSCRWDKGTRRIGWGKNKLDKWKKMKRNSD